MEQDHVKDVLMGIRNDNIVLLKDEQDCLIYVGLAAILTRGMWLIPRAGKPLLSVSSPKLSKVCYCHDKLA